MSKVLNFRARFRALDKDVLTHVFDQTVNRKHGSVLGSIARDVGVVSTHGIAGTAHELNLAAVNESLNRLLRKGKITKRGVGYWFAKK